MILNQSWGNLVIFSLKYFYNFSLLGPMFFMENVNALQTGTVEQETTGHLSDFTDANSLRTEMKEMPKAVTFLVGTK